MTSLLGGPGGPLRFWSDADIRARVTLESAVEAVRDVCLSDDRFEQPQRLSLGHGRLLVMAARAGRAGDAVVKIVHVVAHGEPASPQPSVRGLVVCLDPSGDTAWVADADTLTVLRTAAMVSLATDLLAPPRAARLAVLGAGRQARGQAHAVALVRDVREIAIWNRTRERADVMASELAGSLPGTHIVVHDRPEDAVAHAQIVCCATASTSPLFDASALADEVHVNAVGSYRPDMRELSPELLRHAAVVAVDDVDACQAEAGEIIDAVAEGALDPRGIRTLSSLLAGPGVPGGGRTVFKSVGMATADLAVARLLTDPVVDGRARPR